MARPKRSHPAASAERSTAAPITPLGLIAGTPRCTGARYQALRAMQATGDEDKKPASRERPRPSEIQVIAAALRGELVPFNLENHAERTWVVNTLARLESRLRTVAIDHASAARVATLITTLTTPRGTT